MDTTKPVTHISLCAGYGGIDLGLKRAIPSLRTVAFSEIEAFACANLVAKMEAGCLDPAPIWTDVKTFPWSEFHGKVDILSGGYPCQPFSAAGKRLGKDDPRHLWPWIADGIRVLQPALCFFENVEGHISLGLRDVIGELEESGYRTTWGLFSAAEVGAPHQRKRVFILAHRLGAGLERLGGDVHRERRQSEGKDRPTSAGCISPVWPSRPGQPQHEWEPPRVVGLENATSKRSGSQSGDTVYQGRTSSEAGSASLSQDTHRQAGAAIADHQSTGRDGEPPRVVGDTKSQRSPTFRTEHEGQRGELCASCTSGQGVVGNPSQLQRNGGDDNSGNSQRSEEISESGNASWQGVGNSTSAKWRANDFRSGEQTIETTSAFAASDGRQAEPTLGGNADGSAGGMDYAELCVSCDNRTDELRLLGNGVVPATAERAFLTLMSRLFP